MAAYRNENKWGTERKERWKYRTHATWREYKEDSWTAMEARLISSRENFGGIVLWFIETNLDGH